MPGRYVDRWLHCRHALEPIFLELIAAHDTPFIDLATLSGPIFEAAYSAGWNVDDVAAAIEELAFSYQIRAPAKPAADATEANEAQKGAISE